MVGGLEIPVNFVVALLALLGADVFCPRHVRQLHNGTIDRFAGDGSQQEDAPQRDKYRRAAADRGDAPGAASHSGRAR